MPQTPLQALLGVVNATEFTPKLVGGGQPTAANLKALKAAGVDIVLDLRDPMETRPFDEPALAREAGLEYVNVPVTAGALTDENLDRILATIRDAGDRGVLCHCASGNRVGGALIPYLMLDRAMNEDDAIAEAMRVGLRSAEMMEWGLSYAKRKAGG